MELVQRLEAEGRSGKLCLVDGAPDFLKALTEETLEDDSDDNLQIKLILRFMDMVWPQDTVLVSYSYIRNYNYASIAKDKKLDLGTSSWYMIRLVPNEKNLNKEYINVVLPFLHTHI